MKQPIKRLLSILLCAALLAGASVLPASAADRENPDANTRFLYGAADFAVRGLLDGLAMLFPSFTLPWYRTSPDFLPGMKDFLDEPDASAQWSVGYGRASLIPDGLFDPETKLYIGPEDVFVGGSPKGEDPLRPVIDRKIPTKLIDDMCVRVTA